MSKLKWTKAVKERFWQANLGSYILQITNYAQKEYCWTIFGDKPCIIASGFINPGKLDDAKTECIDELRKRLLAKRTRLDMLLKQL